MSSQFGLMRERRFLPFFLTQFLGAFNDNVFKTALITLVSFRAANLAGLNSAQLATVLPGLFILPYFLFSATSGQLADKFDRSRVIRFVKLFEICIMALAAWGFVQHILWLLVVALFMMGVHSTLFGPAKYAYLPQHLGEHELVGGNGLVEMGTFVAILLGQVLGAAIISATDSGWPVAATILLLAVFGWLASRSAPPSPAPEPGLRIGWNPITETFRNIGFARQSRAVWLALLGISWFWFYGATLLAQFPNFAKLVLLGNENTFILLLSVFSIGIGIGSVLCEKLSRGHVEIGLVPFGAIGMTVFGIDLYLAIPAIALDNPSNLTLLLGHFTHWRMLADIALIGLSGGLYIVPLYAMVQSRSEKSHQSRIMAANNILNSAFMVGSAIISLLLFRLDLSIPQLFLATALFNAVVAIYIYSLLPEFLMRFLVWLVVSFFYRIHSRGTEALPRQGAALLACNHIRATDALVILACSPRPVRFVLDEAAFHKPLLGFILRHNHAIVLQESGTATAIHAALAAGDLVAVFADEAGTFPSAIQTLLATTPSLPLHLRAPQRKGLFQAARLTIEPQAAG